MNVRLFFRLTLIQLSALLLVTACVPTLYAPLPPETPLLYPVSYERLFDATLQALTTSYVETNYGSRLTFSITSAAKETGLISLLREDLQSTWLRQHEIQVNQENIFLDLDRAYYLKVQSIITLVLRPEGMNQASLAYSTSNSWGTSSEIANAFMARVIAKLEAQFLAQKAEETPAASSP